MARSDSARQREENEVEFSRIVAFSDGVFAIAITLLVLNFNVPEHLHESELASALWHERQTLLAFGISFAVIGRFWIVHHELFGEITGFDRRMLGLNLFYLAWIVLIPFSSEVLGEYGGEAAAIVLYAANIAGVVLVGMLMSSDARRAGLADDDPLKRREFTRRSLFIAGVFLLSIPVALVDAGIAQFVWLLLLIETFRRSSSV
jgi:uncharacterized membrane protein